MKQDQNENATLEKFWSNIYDCWNVGLGFINLVAVVEHLAFKWAISLREQPKEQVFRAGWRDQSVTTIWFPNRTIRP